MKILFNLLCRLYWAIDAFWEPFIKDHDRIMVRAINVFGSTCKYCTAYRALIIGAGLMAFVAALTFRSEPMLWVSGLLLIPMAGLVFIERLACRVKSH